MLILRLILLIVLGSFISPYFSVFAYHENPYEVLNVKFNSPLTEIRDAYKRLVKIWHPDKNEHKNKQEAEEKFRKINEAYQELLKLHKQPVTVGNKNHPFFPFVFDFSYSSAIEFLTQLSINFVEYKYVYLPRSSFVPIIFYIYTDRCLLCFEHVPVLNQLKTALEPFRIPLKTVHFARDPSLARKLNYYTIPSLIVLIDGKPLPFKDGLNYFKITEFIKQRLPFPLIQTVEQKALSDFVQIENGDNFARAVFVQHSKPIRFQYYVMAFAYRNRYKFAFVTNKSQSDATDTIFVYNEQKMQQLPHPVVDMQISKSEPSFDLLFDTFDANQFLLLPRLSSRNFFDSLCPFSSSSMRKICLILLVNSGTEDKLAVDEYRQFSFDFKKVITPKSSKLQFTYLYIDKQRKFLQNFNVKTNRSQVLQSCDILALTRFEDQKGLLQYVKFSHLWQPNSANFSDTKFAFYEFIDELLTFKMNFSLSIQFANDLNDEHLLPILRKISQYLHYIWLIFSEDLSIDHVLVSTSIAVTILFVLLIAYLMHYLAKMEEKKINEKFKQNIQSDPSVNANNCNNSTNTSSGVFSSSQVSNKTTPELKLHELRIEKYNGLVRLLKPGCRTIILIVDLKSRMQLIPQFHKIIWPYRKNKCLMFAHMAVERGLGWYRELLQLALPEKCDLKINPRNCVGTVLSLNGYRKYFCMFHAKHPETSNSEKKFMRLRNVRIHNTEKGKNYSYNSKYDSDTDDDLHTNYLIENELLKDLPSWLDRLFEGTTQRYFVNYWPEFTAK